MRIHFNEDEEIAIANNRGPALGYFRDDDTHALLGIDPNEHPLLSTGTYGRLEYGVTLPTIDRILDGDYGRRLLPFAPQPDPNDNGAMSYNAPAFSVRRYSAPPHEYWEVPRASLNAAINNLQVARIGALKAASLRQTPFPPYAARILSRLLTIHALSNAPDLLTTQFQSWFVPEAMRARWVRLHRVVLVFEAYINLHRILDLNAGNLPNSPIGLAPLMRTPEDPNALRLLAAYQRLGIDVRRADGEALPLPDITVDEAFRVIVGEAVIPPGPDFASDDTEETGHDNFLDIESLYPDPRVIGRNRDGTRMMRRDRQQAQEDAWEADQANDSMDDPWDGVAIDPERIVGTPPPVYSRRNAPKPDVAPVPVPPSVDKIATRPTAESAERPERTRAPSVSPSESWGPPPQQASVPLWGEPPSPEGYAMPLGWGVAHTSQESAALPPVCEIRRQPQGTAASFGAGPSTSARLSHSLARKRPAPTSNPVAGASGWSMPLKV